VRGRGTEIAKKPGMLRADTARIQEERDSSREGSSEAS